ncbi:MAG: hypothetical protein QOH97_2391 [Actinoplanes sp.]|jgi:broad specificity phosphatase PhoE|nr:hypothetical protein [Actinoplanes sp.]
MSRLLLIAHAPTPALRQSVFGGDDDLDEGGANAARALRATLPPARSPWWCGPARADRQTARECGAEPVTQDDLADCDYGRWSGLGVAEVAETDPQGLGTWMGDPGTAPHGGESLAAMTVRVGRWLAAHTGENSVVVAAPAVLRAALVYALGLPAVALWQVDVAPLAMLRLDHRGGRWRLHLAPPKPVLSAPGG